MEEVASTIRRLAEEMYSENGHELTGTDCITVDPTQVFTNMCLLLLLCIDPVGLRCCA